MHNTRPATPQVFKIDLAQLLTTGGKELILSEFGIGGGLSLSGDAPARSREQVRYLFLGVLA
jgi:hypothetical protein